MNNKESNLEHELKSLENKLFDGIIKLLDQHQRATKEAGFSEIQSYASGLDVLSDCVSNYKGRVEKDGFENLSSFMKVFERINGDIH